MLRYVEYRPQLVNRISAINERFVLSGCIDPWQLHPTCLGWNPGSNVLMHQETNPEWQLSKLLQNNLDKLKATRTPSFSCSSLQPSAPWASDHVWCRWRRLYRPANLLNLSEVEKTAEFNWKLASLPLLYTWFGMSVVTWGHVVCPHWMLHMVLPTPPVILLSQHFPPHLPFSITSSCMFNVPTMISWHPTISKGIPRPPQL